MHFVGLINVLDLKAGGMGSARRRAARMAGARPARIAREPADRGVRPYPALDRLSRNGAGAPTTARRRWRYLRRFGSVTVLNGHIHQVMQKVEGTSPSTPPAPPPSRSRRPERAASPGPIKGVPADRLRSFLGITDVRVIRGQQHLAVIDTTLAA